MVSGGAGKRYFYIGENVGLQFYISHPLANLRTIFDLRRRGRKILLVKKLYIPHGDDIFFNWCNTVGSSARICLDVHYTLTHAPCCFPILLILSVHH